MLIINIQIIFVVSTLAQISGKNKNSTKIRSTNEIANILYEKCLEYSEARFEITPGKGENKPMKQIECPLSKPLIKGGVPASPKEFPHMAILGFPNSFTDWQSHTNIQWTCGGSLISDRYVLTAAHCRYRYEGRNVEAKWVRLGELVLDSEKDDAKPKDFDIIEFIPHPRYKDSQYYHDIMLLKLNETVKFNPYIRPICLYNRTNLPQKFQRNFIITGWGSTGTGDIESDALRKATVNLVEPKTCSKLYQPDKSKLPAGLKSHFMICAGNEGNDTCQGDSGGPLQALIPDMDCMYYQFGITSYGDFFCGIKNKPGIYTRIAPYIRWIQSIVWP